MITKPLSRQLNQCAARKISEFKAIELQAANYSYEVNSSPYGFESLRCVNPMSLLDSDEASQWLQQFETPDIDTARMLLASLRLVSHTTFHKEVAATLSLAQRGLPSPIAIYVVREVEEGRPYFLDKRSKPLISASGDIGSEGLLATFATGLKRRNPDRFLNHPPISYLRRRRCRHIFLLDDLSASGRRVAEFLRAFLRTDTIRSWWSYGWLTFHIVGYAISEQAEEHIRQALFSSKSRHAKSKIHFWFSRRPVASSQLWPEHVKKEIEDFCERHGKATGIPWQFRKGYRRSMGTLILAHGCPNNAPGIIWYHQSQKAAIFPNRTIPDGLLSRFDEVGPPLDATGLLKLLDAGNLASGEVLNRLSPFATNVVLVLSAIKKRVRRLDLIALAANLPRNACEEVLQRCLELSFIDENNQLTKRGMEELRAFEKLDKLPFEPPKIDNSFYFPLKLRAARG